MKKLSDLKTSILYMTENRTTLVPFLQGPHGIGKTAFVKLLAEESGRTYFTLNLTAIEAADFTGIPYVEGGKTLHARPSFLDYDILFLDEADRVRDADVRSCLNSLLNDRSVNGHKLKDGSMIILAGNSDSNNYETVDFDKSLEDRISRFQFEKFVSVDDRISYFKSVHGNENKFVKFLSTKRAIFKDYSPRRLFEACKIWQDRDCLESVIGKETARVFDNFLASDMVSLDDIIKGKYDIDTMSAMTRISCVETILDSLGSMHEFGDPLQNVAAFINAVSAEEKSKYFTTLQKKLTTGDITDKDVKALDALGMFKGQKIYLKGLFQ